MVRGVLRPLYEQAANFRDCFARLAIASDVRMVAIFLSCLWPPPRCVACVLCAYWLRQVLSREMEPQKRTRIQASIKVRQDESCEVIVIVPGINFRNGANRLTLVVRPARVTLAVFALCDGRYCNALVRR